ncbi:MAG: HAMP domain-containing protein [Deltaproteobacteria bacterium]|nr:HAMP domain-containing protein [Deltaproteobacteria bacterium]
MEPRASRRVRVPWFEAKIVGLLLLVLGATWFAAVYFFGAGISSSFGLILQPSIADGLRTAKARTHDHIEALREQLKWRTERMASELRRLGLEARMSERIRPVLERLAAEDAAAFSGEGEGDGDQPGEREDERSADEGSTPRLIDVSAVDVTGQRVHVRAAGDFPESRWRWKTFRPREPADDAARRAVIDAALEGPSICVVGGCQTLADRLRGGVEVLRVLDRVAERDLASLDAAGLEAVFATPWALFHGLQSLGEVLDTYKMLRMGREQIRRSYVRVYMIILGVAATVTLIVAVLFARRVTRRVAAIARATRQVATGDLGVQIAASGHDELAELARSFNEMVSDLRESRDRIAYLSRVSAWQGIARRLAHEIKNPLTPIQLAIQEVSEKYDGSDERYASLVATAREVIEEEVATLRRLTAEFSAFARLPQVEPSPTDLGEFLDECQAAFGAEAAERGVKLVWRKPTEPLRVLIDRQMMRRVMDNLVRNAVEALAGVEQSDKTVEIEGGPARETDRASIVVRDNGPGIPADVREHIFEPYFTTKPTGTGLGLAIVKKIVLEHSGEIVVESGEKGAEFRLALPLAGGDAARPSEV